MGLIGLSDNLRLYEDHEQGWHTDFARIPGHIKALVKPLNQFLPAFNLPRRGRIVEITATAYAPKNHIELFKQILEADLVRYFVPQHAPASLHPKTNVRVEISDEHNPALYHLLLVARSESPKAYLGHENVYPQVSGFPAHLEHDVQKRLEYLTRATIRGLKTELMHGNAIDEHMEDVLVIYQALAKGWSSVVSPDNAKVLADEESNAKTGMVDLPLVKKNQNLTADGPHCRRFKSHVRYRVRFSTSDYR